jgi:hypothetical protein
MSRNSKTHGTVMMDSNKLSRARLSTSYDTFFTMEGQRVKETDSVLNSGTACKRCQQSVSFFASPVIPDIQRADEMDVHCYSLLIQCCCRLHHHCDHGASAHAAGMLNCRSHVEGFPQLAVGYTPLKRIGEIWLMSLG